MSILSAIGEFIFVSMFIAVIFGIAIVVHVVDFIFRILYLIWKKIA